MRFLFDFHLKNNVGQNVLERWNWECSEYSGLMLLIISYLTLSSDTAYQKGQSHRAAYHLIPLFEMIWDHLELLIFSLVLLLFVGALLVSRAVDEIGLVRSLPTRSYNGNMLAKARHFLGASTPNSSAAIAGRRRRKQQYWIILWIQSRNQLD